MIHVRVVLKYLAIKIFLDEVVGFDNGKNEENICKTLISLYDDCYNKGYQQDTIIHILEDNKINFIADCVAKYVHEKEKTFSMTLYGENFQESIKVN